MNSKATALLIILGAALAACAGTDTDAPGSPPVIAPLPALSPQNVDASMAPPGQSWQVRRLTCAAWLAEPEPEQHSAAMFYYGWLAARTGTQTIDTEKTRVDLQAVHDRCAHEPRLTVANAFEQKLTRPAIWIWQQP